VDRGGVFFSNLARRVSILVLLGSCGEGVIPATSRRPPIPPTALMRELELLFVIPAIGPGTAGAIGRIEEVRFGGLPGFSGLAFWRALSSQDDFVGDQRFRERVSVLIEVEMLGGVGELSLS
jgi:hypothetical protein